MEGKDVILFISPTETTITLYVVVVLVADIALGVVAFDIIMKCWCCCR